MISTLLDERFNVMSFMVLMDYEENKPILNSYLYKCVLFVLFVLFFYLFIFLILTFLERMVPLSMPQRKTMLENEKNRKGEMGDPNQKRYHRCIEYVILEDKDNRGDPYHSCYSHLCHEATSTSPKAKNARLI